MKAEILGKAASRARRELGTIVGRVVGDVPMYWFASRRNFGDAMAPDIVERVFGLNVYPVHGQRSPKLLALGSILHELQPRDVVWGSGAIQEGRIDGRGATFLAVRGPLTRRLIEGDVPEVYGDPGLLLPYLYKPRTGRRYDVGIVPHIDDRNLLRSDDSAVLTVHLATRNWRSVVDQIASCDVIVSSSLHGIVAAEAYGIPTVWVPTRGPIGDGFKFRDHYSATDREPVVGDWSKGLKSVVDRAKVPPQFDTGRLVEAVRETDLASRLRRVRGQT